MHVDAIELRGVTRRFGALTAVDAATLEVAEGEIVGLLGHNGAGKTTLIRLINGLYALDGGTIRVAGLDPATHGHQIRQRVGVLTEYPALDEYLTPAENLHTYGAIHGVPAHVLAGRVPDLLVRLGLDGKADQPARDLSAGLKQRVALARALVHDPATLLLDEPTTNLDPVAARSVRDLVVEAAQVYGRTVLLSTHNLAEAEELCDRVAIMRHGRVLAIGTPAGLRRQYGAVRGVRLESLPDGAPAMAAALPPGVSHRILDPATVEVEGAVTVRALTTHLVSQGIPIDRIEPIEPTLEDLYVHLHGAGDPKRPGVTTEVPA
jgi:ABC-2 type transport system ATP-binding protein